MARRTTASAPPPDEAVEGVPEASTDGATDTSVPATAAPESAPAFAPTSAPTSAPIESGFFAWLRGLGLQRQNGWLGGVCGGIATRIGIDPLLVRGIAVVLAVVGAPVALLYAVAWFLLPDEAGTMHAQQLGRGRVTRALPGIVAVFLASFLPLTQGFWYAGALYWGDLGWGGAAGRIIWTAVLLAGVIVLVVWLARRASRDIGETPATTDDRPETVPSFPVDASADAAPGTAAFAAASAPTASGAVPAPTTAPSEPPAPPSDASAEELAAWKSSQEEWQQQRAAWAAEQRRTERERRQAEAQAQAVEAARRARERARIRKLTRPRASAGIVFLVLGVALVAGAIAAFSASQAPATRGAEWMIGAAVLVIALGLGTVATALGRRRSGALAFFSMLAVGALLVAVVVPGDRTTLPPGSYVGIDTTRDGRYAQFGGTADVVVQPLGELAPVVIDLWQFSGNTNIHLLEGATLQLEVQSDRPNYFVEVSEGWSDGGSSVSYLVGPDGLTLTAGDGEPDVVLTLHTVYGDYLWINGEAWSVPIPLEPAPETVTVWESDGNGNHTIIPGPRPTPTPIPTPDPTDAGSADEGGTP